MWLLLPKYDPVFQASNIEFFDSFFFFLISKISLKKEKGTKSMYTKYVHQICQNYKDKEHVSMKSKKDEPDTRPWAAAHFQSVLRTRFFFSLILSSVSIYIDNLFLISSIYIDNLCSYAINFLL